MQYPLNSIINRGRGDELHLNPHRGDAGGDGYKSARKSVARNAYGFSLHYYHGDYSPISSSTSSTTLLDFGSLAPRLGRRWNTDPVVKDWESPYACFADNPVWFIDPDGNDWDPSTTQCMTSPFGLQANAFSNFGNQQIQFGGLGTYKVNIFGTSTSKTSLTFNATALVAVSGSQNSIGILGGNLYGTAGLMFNWTNGLRGPNRRSYFSIGYQIEPRFNLGYFAKQSNISASINTFTGLGSFGNFQFSIGNDYFAPFGYNGEYGGFHKTDGGLSMNVNFGLWIKDYKYGFTISNETYTAHRKMGFGTEPMETPDGTKGYMAYNGFALVSHYKGDSRSYTGINFSFKTDYGTIIKGTFGWQDDRVRKFFQGVIHIKTNSPEIKYVYGVHYIYLQGSIIYPIRNNRTYPIMNKSKF